MKEKEGLQHIMFVLEKEIVMRSLKHYFNQQLKGCSEIYVSSLISHFFNCLLAPFPYLEQLNAGKIAFDDNTIQSSITEPEANKNAEKKVEAEEAAPVQEKDLSKMTKN